MASELNIEDVDVDGAVRESAERADFELGREGDTRAGFLKKVGLAGGAAVGGGAILGSLVPQAIAGGRPPSSFGRGDVGILNFALTLEYLEAEFYKEAQSNNESGIPFITDGSTRTFLEGVVRDETAHVEGLRAALGNKAVDKPNFDFRDRTSDQEKFQRTSFQLENTGVRAYLGQAYNIESKKIGKVALSIVTIEARHAGLIGEILRGSPNGIAPQGPYDKPLTAKRVLRKVEATGFIQG